MNIYTIYHYLNYIFWGKYNKTYIYSLGNVKKRKKNPNY